MADGLSLVGPFGDRPRLAVAVSGGPDSTALALLALDWVRVRGGTLLGLIVDHGLREGSAAEAELVLARLRRAGVPARVLTLTGVRRTADAARRARYAALEAECAREGIVHLLLGHHAADQAETVQIRVLGGSRAGGFAGMAALREGQWLRLLRPMLGVPPGRLRQFLAARGVPWVVDPSNEDKRALRGRLRLLAAGHGVPVHGVPVHGVPVRGVPVRGVPVRGVPVLSAAASAAGRQRAAAERAIAAWLAANAMIFPEGYAVIPPGRVPEAALSALLRTLGGACYAPPTAAVARLAADPCAATLGGVRMLPAGRLGPGWLLVREAAACAPPVAALAGALWDGRFRLGPEAACPKGTTVSALAADAARFRRRSALPHAVLQALPAIRLHETLVAVPHIGYDTQPVIEGLRLQFSPPVPAACAQWISSETDWGCAEAAGILCSDRG